MLHWYKCRFLMFENNKSKASICIKNKYKNSFVQKTIRPRVKAVEKIYYYFHILFLLFAVSHWIWFQAAQQLSKSVSQNNSKCSNNHDATFESTIISSRIHENLCFFTLQVFSYIITWLLKNLRNLYSKCEFNLLEISGVTPITDGC